MSDTNQPRQITVSEMSPHVHSFGPGENKVIKISTWLIKWIEKSLEIGRIKPLDMLPSKGELAFHIGVSKGTIQNVFRYIEDCGIIESKQRIGTYIKPKESSIISKKLTSKREIATEVIKKIILEKKYKPGEYLLSTRKLSLLTGISNATVRMAINTLISQNILKKVNNTFVIERTDITFKNVKAQTLVEKTSRNLKKHVHENYEAGDRLPANTELAKIFSVSIKTIHDSIKLLIKEGVLYARRGQYGTIVADNRSSNSLYYYEKIELKIRHYIAKNCDIGSRLPSILTFADQYGVSAKTIKKALDNLVEEGYITFTRGRYGGTFVTDIPQGVNEAYKWLALNPEYATNIEKLEN